MYIEIYLDSLFLINFVMNFYLLLLLNHSTHRTATRLRMVLGAAAGALFSLFPFFMGGNGIMKLLVGVFAGTSMMLLIAFRVRNIKGFFRILEKLLLFSFLMGGGLFFLVKSIFLPPWITVGVSGVLALGGLLYLLVSWMVERGRNQSSLCKVILDSGEKRITVTALVDSGNSLTEPISGKPVSVINWEMFYLLWEKEPELFRVIPYRSVGKKRGLLKGYFLKAMEIELDGVTKICREVCVAVSEEALNGADVLVNPVLLMKKEMRQNSDSKICNIKKNAVECHSQREAPPAEKRRYLLYRRSRDTAPAAGTGQGESGHQ